MSILAMTGSCSRPSVGHVARFPGCLIIMDLQKKLTKFTTKELKTDSSEKILTHRLGADLDKLSVFPSSRALNRSQIYKAMQQEISQVTYGYEYGFYADTQQTCQKKPFYRSVLWNMDHGIHYKGILDALRNRALVSQADIYFFPAVDIGMARSHNQDVVRSLAMELGYNYFFATSFINLPSENSPDGKKNALGLEGNAIMTRLPLSNLRILPLSNDSDPIQSPEKKIGCEKVILADVTTDHGVLTLVCINFLFATSKHHRTRHLKKIFKMLQARVQDTPILMGGDFKTTTYQCKNSFGFLLSLMNKIFRGYDYIMQEHHVHPQKYFDKGLFDEFMRAGFDYKLYNEMGHGSLHVPLEQLILDHTKPDNLVLLAKKIAAKHSSSMSFKTDWLVANEFVQVSESYQAERPKVIAHLFHDGKSVSSHDPVLLDFEIRKVDSLEAQDTANTGG